MNHRPFSGPWDSTFRETEARLLGFGDLLRNPAIIHALVVFGSKGPDQFPGNVMDCSGRYQHRIRGGDISMTINKARKWLRLPPLGEIQEILPASLEKFRLG